MPIYQYKCQRCGEITEFFSHSFFNSETLACPSCGNRNLERLISAPNLLKASASTSGTTCCGRTERCDTPQCSTNEGCRRAREG